MEYFTRIYWSEQDGCYLVEVPDLPGCVADGMTEAEARQNAKESAERWIEAAKYFGKEFSVPPPNPQEAEVFIETRRLSNRDRGIFLALLDADPEPTEAAKKAAAEYNEGWHIGGEYHFQLPAPDAEDDGKLNEDEGKCGF